MKTRFLTSLACVLVLAGCSFTGPTAKHNLAIPGQWNEASTQATLPSPEWWRSFGSAQLDQLIADAFRDSPDLRAQGERVIQAELALRSTSASLFPSLDLSANTGKSNKKTRGSSSTTTNSTSLGLSASYELDLWGRVSAHVASARSGLEATRYDYDSARLSLAASIASTYFQYLATAERLRISRENLGIAANVLKIVEARYRWGAASALDVSRQQTAVLSQRAQIEPLEVQLRQTRSALDILRGHPPGTQPLTETPASTLAQLSIPEIGAGLPSELLLRRPDIATAEARMAAAAADIGAARAELFPSISLSAGGNLASPNLLSLADPTRTLSISAGLVQSVFDHGKRRINVKISRSKERELLEGYRKTILTSLKEVEDALSASTRDTHQEEAQIQILAEAERSLHLAEVRYREGADDHTTLLDAQRTRFSAQDQLAQLRQARLTDAITLYKALGGGWSAKNSMAPYNSGP